MWWLVNIRGNTCFRQNSPIASNQKAFFPACVHIRHNTCFRQNFSEGHEFFFQQPSCVTIGRYKRSSPTQQGTNLGKDRRCWLQMALWAATFDWTRLRIDLKKLATCRAQSRRNAQTVRETDCCPFCVKQKESISHLIPPFLPAQRTGSKYPFH